VPKEKIVAVEANLNPLENLIKRVKDEKLSKADVVEVFQKIIDQKEAEI
jgi:hypothetical protein